MLGVIPVKGTVISADAMHCQKDTVKKIRAKQADYVLQVKNNQKNLHKEIAAYFHKVKRETPEQIIEQSDIDGEHGRIVEQTYRKLAIIKEHTKYALKSKKNMTAFYGSV